MKMYKIFYETLRSNNRPVVGHLAYRIDTKTRHVRRKMASAFFLSPKISAFHDTRRCRIHVNRLIVYPTSLDRTRSRLQFLTEKSPANKTIAHTRAENLFVSANKIYSKNLHISNGFDINNVIDEPPLDMLLFCMYTTCREI